MTDKMKVYSKVTEMIKQFLPTTSQYHQIVLSMMVTGIVLGQNAQLSRIGYHVPSKAKPASLEKRFHRFVKNDKVIPDQIYMPFAQQILAHLGKKVTVMIDATQIGRGNMAIVVAVIYKKRAIPLVWLVYKGNKGHTTSERHQEALELLKPLLADDVDVVLLGDGEYDTVGMLEWVTNKTNWTFIVRTAPNIILTSSDIGQFPIRDLLGEKDTYTSVQRVRFTQKQFGPVHTIAWWENPYKKPIYLVSNSTENPILICKLYKLRFKIETMFSDQKGRGFHIEKTHLSSTQRVGRLLLATAIAYIWMVYLGVEVKADEHRRCIIDRSKRTDKSLFRLGLDWLTYALTNGVDFKVLFRPPPQYGRGVW